MFVLIICAFKEHYVFYDLWFFWNSKNIFILKNCIHHVSQNVKALFVFEILLSILKKFKIYKVPICIVFSEKNLYSKIVHVDYTRYYTLVSCINLVFSNCPHLFDIKIIYSFQMKYSIKKSMILVLFEK